MSSRVYTSSRPRPYRDYADRVEIRTFYTNYTHRFEFDSTDKWQVIVVEEEWDLEKGPTYVPKVLKPMAGLSSKEVFQRTEVLPYNKGISVSQLQKHPRFQEVGVIHTTPFFQSGQRRIYRITDTVICDEYGRVFKYQDKTETWRWIPLNLGADHRATTTIDGLSLPNYYWTGIAGYSPDRQVRILDTPSIEIHHTTENTLLLSPFFLAPIPASLHRDYVHYTSRYGKYAYYFTDYPGKSPYFRYSSIDLYYRPKK